MSGIIQFRPVEANLTHDTDWLGKMDPYCKFSHGGHVAKSSVCRHGGTRPHWGDVVSLQTGGVTGVGSNLIRLEIFDKDKFRPDDHVAYTDIDLNEIQQVGQVNKWYPLYHKKKPAGEILIEAALQQQQQAYVQNVIPTTTTYVQETVLNSIPGQQVVGESYVVSETVTQGGILNQGLVGSTGLGSYNTTVDPNLYNNAGLIGGTTYTSGNVVGGNPGYVGTGLASKVSALGPSGGLSHGHHTLKGQTNAGYSERPGYTLGDAEANPTCQSNLDSNGGGLFNKPGREKRAEPYSLSNPGTYGIPHGQTIDTAGHLRPDVALQRQAPIGTINHPGVTGYVDSFTNQPGNVLGHQQGQTGLNQGSYGTGLSTGTGLNTGYGQQGSYGTGLSTGTGLNTGYGQSGLNQGSYTTTGLNTGLNTGYGQSGLGQGSYTTTGLDQQGLGLGQQGLGLGQQGFVQQGLGQQGLTQQGLNQQGLGQGSVNAGLGNQTFGTHHHHH